MPSQVWVALPWVFDFGSGGTSDPASVFNASTYDDAKVFGNG